MVALEVPQKKWVESAVREMDVTAPITLDSFLPQSGRLLYAINDAHNHGVTAIAGTHDCQKIVSGGMEGEVRVWRIGRQTQIMEGSLKEHRGRVSDIKINK